MASIFTKIIAGDIPSYRIYEDEKVYAFLDIRPMAIGHTLVIPKTEVDYIFDVDDELYSHMFIAAKKIAQGIKAVVPCKKVGLSVVGLEVPHAHIHLLPMNEVRDMQFGKDPIELSPEAFEELARKIADHI